MGYAYILIILSLFVENMQHLFLKQVMVEGTVYFCSRFISFAFQVWFQFSYPVF